MKCYKQGILKHKFIEMGEFMWLAGDIMEKKI